MGSLFPQNTWDYVGSHTMTVTSDECAGTYDDCGVCDGDNTSCADCAGIPNGDAQDLACGCNDATSCLDSCGVANGDGTSCLYANVTFGAFDAAAGTAEVLYDFGSPVAGFQFDVAGLAVTGASGGAAGDAGFLVDVGGGTVLGVSLTGDVMPAGAGTLTVLSFSEITADTAELLISWDSAFSSSGGTVYSSTGDTLTHPVDCAGTYYGSLVLDCLGVCDGEGAPLSNLFFSEHAEGSSNNKYFEVHNPTAEDVNLSCYQFVNCANDCDDWEYMSDFAEGAMVEAGGTYTVCHGSFSGDQTLCDETRTLYHNGDDAQGLIHTPSSTLLDVVGDIATSGHMIGM